MGTLKNIEDNLKSTYSLLSERGILGGLYFGSILFIIIIQLPDRLNIEYPWILLVTSLLGILISNISYELFLPVFRFISRGLVLKGANNAISNNKDDMQFRKYEDLREYREIFLNSESNLHLKDRIKGHENLRITLTYIASTNITSLVFMIIFSTYFQISRELIFLIYFTIFFAFISTLIGILMRAYFLGKYIGYGYKVEKKID